MIGDPLDVGQRIVAMEHRKYGVLSSDHVDIVQGVRQGIDIAGLLVIWPGLCSRSDSNKGRRGSFNPPLFVGIQFHISHSDDARRRRGQIDAC